MGRPLRLVFPGAWWHVTNRGVEKRSIFLDDHDRRAFLELIADAVPEFVWRLHAFVLMTNHFHLLIETPEATLSQGMKSLQEKYATAFNKKWGRVGHLYQGRFKAECVDSETYLVNVARYVVLNPVRAKFVRTPGEWPWSSYAATAGIAQAPLWLSTTAILDRFDPVDHGHACSEYCRFVSRSDAIDDRSWQHRAARERAAALAILREAMIATIGVGPEKGRSTESRMAFALIARSEIRASINEVALDMGMSRTGVNNLVRRGKDRCTSDPRFAEMVESLRLKIRN